MTVNRRFGCCEICGDAQRRCTQCQNWFAETRTNFAYNSRTGRYNSWCKSCVRAHNSSRRYGTTSADRTFGVEIEFIGNSIDVVRQMVAVGLSCQNQEYNHRVSRTMWKIVPDGSVGGGAELVSPVLSGEDGFRQIMLASEALRQAGVSVNTSTGLHVHHDIRNLTVSAMKRLAHNWADSQTGIDQLVSPSRRTDRRRNYLGALTMYDLEEIDGISSMSGAASRSCDRGFRALDRYRNINFSSYARYGTVEIRQHQGTIDGEKITAWIKFGQAMINAAIAGTDLCASDGTSLINDLPWGEDSTSPAYLTARVAVLSQQRRKVGAR
jgi:hypothetical protein